MASVGTPEIVFDHAQDDGRRYVRVMFPCLDHDSNLRDVFIGPRLVAADLDVLAWANGYKDEVLDELILEEEQGILKMRDVANPLTYAQNPKWSTTKGIGNIAIRHMMTERDTRFVIYLEPLITYIRVDSGWTTEQIMNFLDITLSKLQRMNRRINKILSNTGATVASYTAAYDAEEGEF